MANNSLSGFGSYQQPVYPNNNGSYPQNYASYPQNHNGSYPQNHNGSYPQNYASYPQNHNGSYPQSYPQNHNGYYPQNNAYNAQYQLPTVFQNQPFFSNNNSIQNNQDDGYLKPLVFPNVSNQYFPDHVPMQERINILQAAVLQNERLLFQLAYNKELQLGFNDLERNQNGIIQSDPPKKVNYNTKSSLPAVEFSREKPIDVNSKLQELWKKLEPVYDPSPDETKFFPYSPSYHRFQDIRCTRHSSIDSDGCLNANIVTDTNNPNHPIKTRLNLVASQAPKDQSLFWDAIFKNDYFIIDLTTPNDRIAPYYPVSASDPFKAGNYVITLKDENGITKKYKVFNLVTGVTKDVERVHINNWADYSDASLKTLHELVMKIMATKKGAWLHCRAGVGRTGTAITAALLYEKMMQQKVTKEDLFTIIPEIINKVRNERNPNCVQTFEQFKMLYNYGAFLIDQKSERLS